MIFVTVGNATQPFSRLINAMIALRTSGAIDEQLVIQHGYTPPPDWSEPMFAFMKNELFEEHIRRASVIVAHAGCGTLMSCIRAGKMPVAVPRLRAFGEHVNDHQLQLADGLAVQQRVIVCRDLDRLAASISRARGMKQTQPLLPSKLPELVSAAVESLIDAARRESSRSSPRERAKRS